MPTITCNAAALVPATATSQAHVHKCSRQVADVGDTHLGQHHCGECRSSFVVDRPAPLATEKCEACGAIQPMENLREMHPEPDVTQYVCVDTTACSARVVGRQQQSDMRWPLVALARPLVDAHMLGTPLIEPMPQQDPAQAMPGLVGAIGIIRGLRDVVDDLPRGTVGRVTLQRHLAQLERALIEYRPPEPQMAELVVEPGVVDQVADLGKRVIELERAVANLIDATKPKPTLLHVTPPYVHRLLDAYLNPGQPLNFRGWPVPLDVQLRLEDARPEGCHLIEVRTDDGRVHHPSSVQLVYGP